MVSAAVWIVAVGCAGVRMTVHGTAPPTTCAKATVVDTAMYQVSQVDEPPVFRRGPMPRMPAEFRGSSARGRVTFLFAMQASGMVDTASVTLHGASDTAFIPAARDALLSTTYWPACLNGHPVRVSPIQQAFTFSNS